MNHAKKIEDIRKSNTALALSVVTAQTRPSLLRRILDVMFQATDDIHTFERIEGLAPRESRPDPRTYHMFYGRF